MVDRNMKQIGQTSSNNQTPHWSLFHNRYCDWRPTLITGSANKGHREFRKIWFNKSFISKFVCFSIIGALDHGDVLDISYFFNRFVVFNKFPRLINGLPFPHITFFLHKLKCKYCISTLVVAKHVLDQDTPSNLILRYIESITCSWLRFYGQQNRLLVINRDYVRKASTRSSQPSCTPVSDIETLYQGMLVTISSTSAKAAQSDSITCLYVNYTQA